MFSKCCVDTLRTKRSILPYLGLLLLLTAPAEARVFDITKQTISTFIRGTYGTSGLGEKPFGESSGASTEFTDSFTANTSGEFGVFMGAGQLGFRLSAEFLNPKSLKAIAGKNSGGTSLMTLDSNVAAVIYKFGMEYSWYIDGTSKMFFSASGGSATVNLTNTYELTAAGNAAYGGVPDHVEKGSETLFIADVSFGYENNFSDDTTLIVDLGWRQFQANDLKHSAAATTFLGSVVSGGAMLNHSGGVRTLDLGGFYIGMGLRFYINR